MSLADHLPAERRARILTLDIETSPNLGYYFSPKVRYVTPDKRVRRGGMLSFAAKWYGVNDVEFYSTEADGHDAMVRRAHAMLSAADVLVTYNGDRFDVKHMNTEFARLGLLRPAPFKSVDLIKTVRSQFAFDYNRLDEVCRELGLPTKVTHQGFTLWRDCIDGEGRDRERAWALMERYNRQDVRITERLYTRLLPWITNHPHMALLIDDADACPNCASKKRRAVGDALTALTAYAQYQCANPRCGVWLRTNYVKRRVSIRTVR